MDFFAENFDEVEAERGIEEYDGEEEDEEESSTVVEADCRWRWRMESVPRTIKLPGRIQGEFHRRAFLPPLDQHERDATYRLPTTVQMSSVLQRRADVSQ